MIRAVVFDLGGVACHFDPAPRLRAFADRCGLTEEEVQARLWDSGFSDAHDEGRHTIATAYRNVIETLGFECTLQECCRLWLKAFTPTEGVLDLVRDLRRRGVRTALLTNNGPLLEAALRNVLPSVWSCFDGHFFSASMCVSKPDRRAFETVMTALGTLPTETAFVDDSPSNVAAATALGWASFCFQDNPAALETWLNTQLLLRLPS